MSIRSGMIHNHTLYQRTCLNLRWFIAALLVPTISQAASNEPFSMGYSMGNNGTIMQPEGISGRQPWLPACLYADSLHYGLTVCGIDYYDPMDNFEGNYIGQVALGGWYARSRFIAKAAYAYFNALNLYNEQQGFCSMGMRLVKHLQASIEITGLRAGLTRESQNSLSELYCGVSCLAYGKNGAFSFSCNHIPLLAASKQGIDEPLSAAAGLYARFDQYGSQGLVCQVTHEKDWAFRCSLGEEYCWNKYLALCGAVAMNPFAFFFGCTISLGRSTSSFSLANHMQLGWSKGLTIDYAQP